MKVSPRTARPPSDREKPMNGFFLYFRYIRLQFLSGVQYKGWWMMIPQVFLVVVTDPISTIFMFSRFGTKGNGGMEGYLQRYTMPEPPYGLPKP